MKKLLIILLLSPSLLFCQESEEIDWFNLKSDDSHWGVEWNVFWNWGDNDILLADYFVIRDSNGDFVSFEDNKYSFDIDLSIQTTFYKRIILRYSFISLKQDMAGPIGIDRSYTLGDRNDINSNLEVVNYDFDGSGKVIVSNIFSLGYPLKVFKLNENRYFSIIPFVGIDFQKVHLMDIYVRHEGFSDWYFLDEFDWRLENKTSESKINFSFGISIPAWIQISYIRSKEVNRIMFGIGI